MCEVVETQLKTNFAAVGVETHDIAERFHLRGLAIGGKSHDFEFVAKFQKAEVLGNRAVVEAEGMRKGDRTVDIHAIAAANAPHGTGKVSKAVGRENGGIFKRRDEVRAGEMGLMMFYAMEGCIYFYWIGVEGCAERVGNSSKFGEDFGTLARKGRHAHGVPEFCAKASVGIARDSDMIDVG